MAPECDCFNTTEKSMRLDQALVLLKKRIKSVTSDEIVSLRHARGRILAKDVIAGRDVPPHDNSAMDGYAVFFDDLNPDAETRLPISGRIAAGHPLTTAAMRGHAYRIFTGAPMPAGADTVFMQEHCTLKDEHVILNPGIECGANRRHKGEDISAGTIILKKGHLLRPQEIALAASVGCSELSVRKKLTAAVFSTGDEVRDPGDDAFEGCIFDSNRYAVMGLLEGLGCQVSDLGIQPDDLATIKATMDGASRDHDLLITSGGVSVGDEDHVKAAVEALGSLHFWRLAIKPGRPVALGKVANAAFVGLPGNPVSAMVTFMLIARPLILLLSGRKDIDPRRFKLRSGFSFNKKPGRREWLRAHLQTDADGNLLAMKYAAQGSGVLSSMVDAYGLIEMDEDMDSIKEGDMVSFLPFSEVSS